MVDKSLNNLCGLVQPLRCVALAFFTRMADDSNVRKLTVVTNVFA